MAQVDKFIEWLIKVRQQKFIYIPQPGEIGGALLSHATYRIFTQLGCNYRICNNLKAYTQQLLVCGGGEIHGFAANAIPEFINNNIEQNKIVLLPQTISNLPQIANWLTTGNLIIFCREPATFEYLMQLSPASGFYMLADDLTCYLNTEEFCNYRSIRGKGICSVFYNNEFVAALGLTINNFALGQTWEGSFWHNPELCKNVVHSAASYLAYFAQVHTDNIHTAVLAAILGKKVTLYFFTTAVSKALSLYEFTLRKRWPNLNLAYIG
jgi:hypothetical protein